MATVTPTQDRTQRGLITYSYTFGTGASNVGAPIAISDYPDKTITIEGTFGGATITLQGSNSAPTASKWHALSDVPADNTIIETTTGIFVILENPKFMRPIIGPTVSGTTDIDVIIHGNKAARR